MRARSIVGSPDEGYLHGCSQCQIHLYSHVIQVPDPIPDTNNPYVLSGKFTFAILRMER